MIPDADIHPQASRELEEAALFYDQRVEKLGGRFLRNVEKAVEQILLFPKSAPVVGKTVRQKTLSAFPYSIFYIYENHEVFIVAVAHQKRQPMYWIDRLPN